MVVKKGDKVKIEYEGRLEDGTVFDSSEKHGCPLEFEVGTQNIIPGFSNAVIGMKKGQEKEVKIKPEDAYGQSNPTLLKKVPRDQFPSDHEPKEGMMLALGTPDGQQFPAMITKVTEKEVTIDLNHPLAGKALIFKMKLVDVSS